MDKERVQEIDRLAKVFIASGSPGLRECKRGGPGSDSRACVARAIGVDIAEFNDYIKFDE